MTISVHNKVENIVGKGDYAGCRQILLFQHFFQKLSVLGPSKLRTVWKVLNTCMEGTLIVKEYTICWVFFVSDIKL